MKRLLGRKFSERIVSNFANFCPFKVERDHVDDPVISIDSKDGNVRLQTEEISSKLFEELRDIAEQHLFKRVKQAVVTVPVHFSFP
jgi:L1 cell adhesion molecule like protein